MIAAQPFAFSAPTNVHFGDGVSTRIADVLPKGVRSLALIRGGRGVAAEPLVTRLRTQGYAVAEVRCAGEPSVASINAAVDELRPRAVEAVVACGGGAVLDTGKAVAFCLGHDLTLKEDFSAISADLLAAPGPIPCIAVPTTAGTGAEVTANAVLELPSRGAKVSLRGRALFPVTALVDPLLLPSARRETILSSGLDAVVQTIESYTSCAATPFSDALTRLNIDLGLRSLRAVIKNGTPQAWRDLAWVSMTSGLALANSGLGAAHGLASVLGGRYGAPHGVLCGRFLVPVLRQNLKVADPRSDAHRRILHACAAIAEVFAPKQGGDDLSGLESWQNANGLPRLASFGVVESDFAELASQSAGASSSKKNAVVLEDAHYAAILAEAL
ncbi:iron-containing alcohol dehydrogenase [Tropicimonas sp. S265A]|uniref:iron-containing alcohol dehydrogenase n=1 Tax=Tropicimonas sp. S265A TaxID=3415134 RepID=UPI003C7EBD73